MAFLPVKYKSNHPSRTRSFSGEGETSVGEQVYSYAQTAISIVGAAAEAAVTTGLVTGAAALGVLGVVAAAAGYIGIVLVVIYVIYSLIMGNQAKVRMYRKIRMMKRERMKEIGVYLIDQVYGMAIPGWSFEAGQQMQPPYTIGEYYDLGSSFYGWSQMEPEDPEYEPRRKFIAIFLRDRGLDPTRIMGFDNVKEGEHLLIMETWVALPERILLTKESLQYLGYESSMVDNLSNDFLIRMFDMIKSMGRVKTEEQAVLIKKDIEDWLISASLDPRIFFQKGATEAGIASVPSPINSKTISPQSSLLPGEAEERAAIEKKVSMSPMIIAGIVIGGILMLSGKREVAG